MTTCCTMDDCEKPRVSRGWCWMHYARWYRHGDPSYDPPRRRPKVERFWRKVDKTSSAASGCWLWTGSRCFQMNGVQRGAHVWAYEATGAIVPPTYEVLRTCGSPLCVHPDHLECMPKGTAFLRSMNKKRKQDKKQKQENKEVRMKNLTLQRLIPLAIHLAPKEYRAMVTGIVHGLIIDGIEAMRDGKLSRKEWMAMAGATYDTFRPELKGKQ
jgi:hypothetical protein